MKKNILFAFVLILPFIGFGQWGQLGNDMNGINEGDSFGRSVAFSGDGTVMASGSPDISENGDFSGQTRVFDWDGNAWAQRGEAINGQLEDWSGTSVGLSDDGNTLAIGAVFAVNGDNIRSGLVRIYDWDGTEWSQRGDTIFGIGNPQNFLDSFGRSLSISADGNIIAIGAPGRWGPTNNIFQSGQVSVYEWDGSSWELRGDHVFGAGMNEDFGFSVSLTADGTTFVAGGQGFENPNTSVNFNGRVRVFDWDGTAWIKRGESIDGVLLGDDFGKAVNISDNGNVFVAGAPGYDVTTTDNLFCTARIFEWDGSSWVQRGVQLQGDTQANGFGDAVSISSSGEIVAIGAPIFGANSSVQVYKWDGVNYVQAGATLFGPQSQDIFGSAIALNSEANRLAIGAWGDDGNGDGSGVVRVFENPTLGSTTFAETEITYFPNPTSDFMTFTLSEAIESITMYSILGQKLFTVTPNLNEYVLDLSNLDSGQYIATITTINTIQTIKLIRR